MIRFLLRKWIPDSDNIKDPIVRKAYGTCSSIIGICCNLLLFLSSILPVYCPVRLPLFLMRLIIYPIVPLVLSPYSATSWQQSLPTRGTHLVMGVWNILLLSLWQ